MKGLENFNYLDDIGFNHLDETKFGYFEHLCFTVNFAYEFFKGGILTLCHGLFPDFFVTLVFL